MSEVNGRWRANFAACTARFDRILVGGTVFCSELYELRPAQLTKRNKRSYCILNMPADFRALQEPLQSAFGRVIAFLQVTSPLTATPIVLVVVRVFKRAEGHVNITVLSELSTSVVRVVPLEALATQACVGRSRLNDTEVLVFLPVV